MSITILKRYDLELNLKLFWILSFVLISFLSIFYIFQSIQITQESYLILDYENQIKVFDQENEGLEMNFAENYSLDDVEALAYELDYEKLEKIHYIKTTSSVVVVK